MYGSKIKVGVIRGGPSSEYEVSLKTGLTVLKNIPDSYHVSDIFISRDGKWHYHGFERPPERILKHVDVVFNALHGEYGEDGKVQKLLEDFYVPFTGSKSLPSAMGMNKILSKKVFKSHDIPTPHHIIITKEDAVPDKIVSIFRTFPHPCVVKPASSGSSVGVTIANDYHSLEEGINKALKHSPYVLIEEYIRGREATCGVVDNFRKSHLYSLLPVEIIKPKTSAFFDYDAKYSGKSEEICPGNFSKEEKEEIQRLAVLAHKSLGLRHYSRSDFIITPRGKVYILEVNTLPALTDESLLPKSLQAIGCSMPDFLHHLLTLAIDNKR